MPDNLDVEMTENDILRQLIVEENDAVISYTERAEQVTDPKIRAVLLDIAEEEKVHAGELSALLSESDPEQDSSMIEGAEEVEDMESKIEKSWRTFKEGNHTSIEDKIDVLLAQNQEIQVDTERTADLVPAVLGDKAEEDYEDEDTAVSGETELAGEEGTEDAYAYLDDIDDELMGGGESEEGSESDVSYTDGEGEPAEEESDVDFVSDIVEDDGESIEEESDVEYMEEEPESEEEPEDESVEEESEEEPEDDGQDEDDDEKGDVTDARKSHGDRPSTRTIKEIGHPAKKVLVMPVSRPPATSMMGHDIRQDVLKALAESDQDEPVMFGHGVDPHEVVRKDKERWSNLTKLINF